MKKISILLIAILFLFATNVSAKIIPAEKEGWNTFIDEKSGLMIDFPDFFEVEQVSNSRDIHLSGNKDSFYVGVIISFLKEDVNYPENANYFNDEQFKAFEEYLLKTKLNSTENTGYKFLKIGDIYQEGMRGARIAKYRTINGKTTLEVSCFYISHKELIEINILNTVASDKKLNDYVIKEFIAPIGVSIRFNYLKNK